MRAARRTRYGPPDVIEVEDAAVPAPADDQLLIRMHAATVSRTDCALLAARPFFMRFMTGLRAPRLQTLGTDFAGRVEAVGAQVQGFQAGDRVWGIRDMGAASHADYLVMAQDAAVSHMPDGVRFEDAVACVEGGWYAYSFLDKVAVGAATRVLINGATGAIGSMLLQLCVHRGAAVTAVGNGKNLDLLKLLGADRVIDYERADFTQDGGVYDYVFDAVGKSRFGACKHLLVPRGVYISSELGPGGQNPFLALLTPALGGKRVVFPIPVPPRAFLDVLRPLVAERHVRPVIDRTYTLDTIREAYAYVASGQKTGAVLLQLAA